MISFFKNIHPFWILWSFLFLLFFFFIFYLMQRRKYYHALPTEYEAPKNINPLLAGYLVDGQFNIRDYIAGFIYLIQQGVIDIDKQKPRKISFTGLDLERAHVAIEKIAHREGYTKPGLPKIVASLLYGMLFLFLLTALIFFIYQITVLTKGFHLSSDSYIFFLSFPFALYLAHALIFLSKMKLTKKGRDAKNALLGFKKFLELAEKDRLKYFNAPEAKPEVFMEYLPYAIALGVDENWNYKYGGLLSKKPSWYSPKFIRLPMLADDMHDILDLIYLMQDHRFKKK